MPISKSALVPLTSVRFLAALRVAVYHFVSWGDKAYWWRGLLATPISVTYFFVSSGFLLAYNYSERSDLGQMDSTRFLLGRVARLLPVYFLGLLVAIPLLLQPGNFSLRKTTLTVFLLQSWFPNSVLYWNSPAWALSDLAFFYLCLPVLLKLTRSASRKTCLLIGGFAWAVSVGLAVAYVYLNPDRLAQLNPPRSPGFWLYVLKYNPLVRLPDFIMGTMAGRFFLLTGGFRRQISSAVFLVSTSLLLAFLLLGHLISYPVINSGLLAPLLAVIICSLASGGRAADFFKQPWFVALGQSSFCLYMLHIPLWAFLYRPSFKYWNIGVLLLIALISLALYEWIEKPATTALRNFLLPTSKPAVLAADTP
jgi:peptidoglycan/LPS O-acetylase OafA/YrhL